MGPLEGRRVEISGLLAKAYAAGSGMRISHETIYKSLFIQTRGVPAKALQKHLRSGRPTRRNIHNTVTGQWRSQMLRQYLPKGTTMGHLTQDDLGKIALKLNTRPRKALGFCITLTVAGRRLAPPCASADPNSTKSSHRWPDHSTPPAC